MNPFRMRKPICGIRRAGFTLLEVTISLGVIGVIVSALFTAASVAQYRVRINQASDELNLIAGNMRTLYSAQNPKHIPTVQIKVLTPTLITQGVFPNEMICAAPLTIVNNPFATNCAAGATIGSVGVGTFKVSPPQFVVQYGSIPAEACADLLMRNSTPGNDTGLVKILTSTSAVPLTTLPLNAIDAAIACGTTGTVTINWYYTIGG